MRSSYYFRKSVRHLQWAPIFVLAAVLLSATAYRLAIGDDASGFAVVPAIIAILSATAAVTEIHQCLRCRKIHFSRFPLPTNHTHYASHSNDPK